MCAFQDLFLTPFDAETGDDDNPAAALQAAQEDVRFYAPRLDIALSVASSANDSSAAAGAGSGGRADPLAALALWREWTRRGLSDRGGKGGKGGKGSDAGRMAAAAYAKSQHASYKRLVECDFLQKELAQRFQSHQREAGTEPERDTVQRLPPESAALVRIACLVATFAPNYAIAHPAPPPPPPAVAAGGDSAGAGAAAAAEDDRADEAAAIVASVAAAAAAAAEGAAGAGAEALRERHAIELELVTQPPGGAIAASDERKVERAIAAAFGSVCGEVMRAFSFIPLHFSLGPGLRAQYNQSQ